MLRKIQKHWQKKNAKILEIGCGTGSNLKILKNYGLVSAMEPSEDAINYLRKKTIAGFNLTCVGDNKAVSFLPSSLAYLI